MQKRFLVISSGLNLKTGSMPLVEVDDVLDLEEKILKGSLRLMKIEGRNLWNP